MKHDTREQIAEILMAVYQIPGEFFIAGIVLIGIGQAFLEISNLGLILIFFGIFFLVLEAISPIIAGVKLYEKAIKNIKKMFK
jgi:hypothetical protein